MQMHKPRPVSTNRQMMAGHRIDQIGILWDAISQWGRMLSYAKRHKSVQHLLMGSQWVLAIRVKTEEQTNCRVYEDIQEVQDAWIARCVVCSSIGDEEVEAMNEHLTRNLLGHIKRPATWSVSGTTAMGTTTHHIRHGLLGFSIDRL